MRVAIGTSRLVAVSCLLLLGCGSARADPLVEGPWCAVYYGRGSGVPRCDFQTLEQCRSEVIAGNRGLCNINPRWSPPPQLPRRRHAAKHH